MLLLTMVYGGDIDLISDINEVKQYFKSKNIVLGICESIAGSTHFIKFFCDEEESTEKTIDLFYYTMAKVLYKIVISEYYKSEMECFLEDSYFFLKSEELQEVEIASMKLLRDEIIINDENSIYCQNRKNSILTKIVECMTETKEININGFITFRMKELLSDIEAIIDKVVEGYIVEKEYCEFIKLLKYFVDVQENKMDLVQIVIDKENEYTVLDSEGKDILELFLDDIDEEKIKESSNIEDLIISGLITNCPKEIIIKGVNNCLNKQLIDTIKKVFENRVTIYEDNWINVN